MRASTGLAGLVVAAVLSSGCSGDAGGPSAGDGNDLAAVGLERGGPPAVPDPNEDAAATMCDGLVVVQGTPGGVFDAETGKRHDLDLRLPGDDEPFDPEEFRIVHPPACVRDGHRWIAAVEFVRRDLSLDSVVAGFDDGGRRLWSRAADRPVGLAASGATVLHGSRVLDPATGEVIARSGPGVIGIDGNRLLDLGRDDPGDAAHLTDADGERVPGAAPVFEPSLVQGGSRIVLGGVARFESDRTTAHDTTTGERLWTVPFGRSAAAPVLDRTLDTLFWMTGSGGSSVVHAVDARTGDIQWKRRLDAASAVTVARGVGLYRDGDTPRLFDARTGAPLRLDEGVWPVAVSDAGLLLLDEDDDPRLVDPEDVTTPVR